MNYQRIYEQLTAKDMIADYTEKHHIIPRCMGGSNDPSNLVCLTPEAHYVAHQLLVKLYPDNHKLIYAANLMTAGKYRNNKLYGWIRQRISTARKGKPQSPEHTAKVVAANKGRKHSAESIEKIRVATQNMSDETKGKMSASRKGKCKSAETRAKMSLAKQQVSNETRSKLRVSHTGKPKSPAHIANISASKKGKPSNLKGTTQSKVICPHCNKEGGVSVMKRHHFDNCKHRRC